MIKYSLSLAYMQCFNSSYTSATPLRWPNLVLKKCEEEEEEENVGPINSRRLVPLKNTCLCIRNKGKSYDSRQGMGIMHTFP